MGVAVDDNDRVLDVFLGVAMNGGDQPGTALFVEDKVPINPRGGARLDVGEDLFGIFV